MRQRSMILAALAGPHWGVAPSKVATLALRAKSGGEVSRPSRLTLPARRSALRAARRLRTRLASARAAKRCSRERAGVSACGAGGVSMVAEYRERERAPARPEVG